MGTSADTAWISERARAVGFDLCGVVRADSFPELARFDEWLGRGYAGEMEYLGDPRRRNLMLVQGDIRSVIVCGLNYNTAHPYSVQEAARRQSAEPRGWISRYAWGVDYHEVMWEKLNLLNDALHERFPERFYSRAYADTGPVAERVYARHAGLGWLGKNTLLLNECDGIVAFSRCDPYFVGACTDFGTSGISTGGFMRQLPAMSGRVPHWGAGGAVRYGCAEVHFLSDDRASR